MFCQLIIHTNRVPLIYRKDLEIKETTDMKQLPSSVLFLDILLKFDTNSKLSIRLYCKREDLNFALMKFPHLDSNIPTTFL